MDFVKRWVQDNEGAISAVAEKYGKDASLVNIGDIASAGESLWESFTNNMRRVATRRLRLPLGTPIKIYEVDGDSITWWIAGKYLETDYETLIRPLSELTEGNIFDVTSSGEWQEWDDHAKEGR